MPIQIGIIYLNVALFSFFSYTDTTLLTNNKTYEQTTE